MSDEPFIEISNREVYNVVIQTRDEVRAMKSVVTAMSTEHVELKKRTRGLELRFYGILAGLITAVAILVAGAAGVGVR